MSTIDEYESKFKDKGRWGESKFLTGLIGKYSGAKALVIGGGNYPRHIQQILQLKQSPCVSLIQQYENDYNTFSGERLKVLEAPIAFSADSEFL